MAIRRPRANAGAQPPGRSRRRCRPRDILQDRDTRPCRSRSPTDPAANSMSPTDIHRRRKRLMVQVSIDGESIGLGLARFRAGASTGNTRLSRPPSPAATVSATAPIGWPARRRPTNRPVTSSAPGRTYRIARNPSTMPCQALSQGEHASASREQAPHHGQVRPQSTSIPCGHIDCRQRIPRGEVDGKLPAAHAANRNQRYTGMSMFLAAAEVSPRPTIARVGC